MGLFLLHACGFGKMLRACLLLPVTRRWCGSRAKARRRCGSRAIARRWRRSVAIARRWRRSMAGWGTPFAHGILADKDSCAIIRMPVGIWFRCAQRYCEQKSAEEKRYAKKIFHGIPPTTYLQVCLAQCLTQSFYREKSVFLSKPSHRESFVPGISP